MAGASSEADIPEPERKPELPHFCMVGSVNRPCSYPIHLRWNAGIGYWYVKCTTWNASKKLHTGWRWPNSDNWLWCSDYRRSRDPRIPPRARRLESADASSGDTVMVGTSLSEPSGGSVASAVLSSHAGVAADPTMVAEMTTPATEASPWPCTSASLEMQPLGKRRRLPASGASATAAIAVPAAPSASAAQAAESAAQHLDYNAQAALSAVARSLKNVMAVSFVEIPFTQGSFGWTFFHQGKLCTCTTICVFVALVVAERFLRQPTQVWNSWKHIDQWAATYSEASRLHSEYFHRGRLDEIHSAIGQQALLTNVVEFLGAVPELGLTFQRFMQMADERALTCLLDSCRDCGRICHVNQSSCACGAACQRGSVGSMQACFNKVAEHARRTAPAPTANIFTVGDRTFFFGVGGSKYILLDSHHRSWTGTVQETSLVLVGSWHADMDLYASLEPVLVRGAMGYSVTDRAAVVSWTSFGTALPFVPEVVAHSSVPQGGSVAEGLANSSVAEGVSGPSALEADHVVMDAALAGLAMLRARAEQACLAVDPGSDPAAEVLVVAPLELAAEQETSGGHLGIVECGLKPQPAGLAVEQQSNLTGEVLVAAPLELAAEQETSGGQLEAVDPEVLPDISQGEGAQGAVPEIAAAMKEPEAPPPKSKRTNNIIES